MVLEACWLNEPKTVIRLRETHPNLFQKVHYCYRECQNINLKLCDLIGIICVSLTCISISPQYKAKNVTFKHNQLILRHSVCISG